MNHILTTNVINRNFASIFCKVLAEDMLYFMTSEPGDDMGNVVAWRDFKRPSSIPEEQFTIEKKSTSNFRFSPS